jgi:putative transposase
MPKLAPQDTRTFFLTLVTANRRSLFQVHDNAYLLLDLFANDRARNRYTLHAFAIMPDHIHVLLTPAPDVSFEKAIQFIKGGYSFRIKSKLDVWQKGYNEHRITDANDYAQHAIYIHENPTRARLPAGYPFTSAMMHHLVDPPPSHLTTPELLPSHCCLAGSTK